MDASVADFRYLLVEFDSIESKDEQARIFADADRLPDLLTVRGQGDLKKSAIDTLRGKIAIAEEAVHNAGEVASQFLQAFHRAALVQLEATIAEVTAGFILAADIKLLMQVASRHPVVRAIQNWNPPLFFRDHIRGFSDDVILARTLELIWRALKKSADTIPGDLSVSIPGPWMD